MMEGLHSNVNDVDEAIQLRHVHDVGRILLDVENEFGKLRDAIRHSSGSDQTSDDIDDILSKAEHELRQKADLILSSSLNSKLAIISTPSPGSPGGFRKSRVRRSPRTHSAEETYRPGVKTTTASHHMTDMDHLLNEFRLQHEKQKKELSQQIGSAGTVRQEGDSRQGRAHGGQNSIVGKQRPVGSSLARRKVIVDASGENSRTGESNERDNNKELATSITHDPAQLYPWSQNHASSKAKVAMACETTEMNASFKLDLDSALQTKASTLQGGKDGSKNGGQTSVQAVKLNQQLQLNGPLDVSNQKSKHEVIMAKEESLGDSVLRIYEYETKMRANGLYAFMIRNGATMTRTSGFLAYKRMFESEWGAISQLITQTERLLSKYAVEIAYINGGKLAELAKDQMSRHTESEILACVFNEDQVRSTVTLPGRAFTTGTEEASELAASAIQAAYRGSCDRRKYEAHKSRDHAARIIVNIIRVSALKNELARRLSRKWATEEAVFQARQRKFIEDWKSIRQSKRTIVHIPSLSYAEHLRLPINRLSILQNLQLSRLCDLAIRDVDIVYVSPFPLPSEIRTYYENLLQLRGVSNVAGRLHIVVPENAHRFPQHMSLASTLRYSPKAISRIRALVESKPAYIVPNHVGEEDRTLALALNLPLLAPEPDVAALYSTKSGAKQVFVEAEVNVPVGAYDIFEETEIYSTLAKLVAANLDVDRWLLKIDDEIDGRGIALLDMNKFRVVQRVRVERSQQTAKSQIGKAYWSRSDVQERARAKLEEGFKQELRVRAEVKCPAVYRTWGDFLLAFTRVGGVIEAMPEQVENVVTVSVLIEPDGATRFICAQDKIHSRQAPFQSVGSVFPQTQIPHAALRSASYAVAKVLHQRGVLGNVSIDYLAFLDPNVQSLRLWALGLNLRVTQPLASFRFFDFLLGGYTEETGQYKISMEKQSPTKGETSIKETQTRAFAMICPLHHPNLATMSYSHFFNACRRHGISYDLRAMQGIAFELADSLSAGVIGVLSINKDATQAGIQLQRSFNFMYKFAGSYVQQSLEDQIFDGTCTFSDALAVSKRLVANAEARFRQEVENQRTLERTQQRLLKQQRAINPDSSDGDDGEDL